MSAGGPAYSSFITISGAMYDGVPQNILIFLSFGMQVENPKSISLTFLLSSNNIFSSLISRWAMLFLWQYYNAVIIYLNMHLASSSSSLLSAFSLR